MNDHDLREELLRLETFSPQLRQRYKTELESMVERRLRPWERVWWCCWAVMGFGFVAVFGAAALIAGPELHWLARTLFGLGAIFGVVWMIICLLILKKGSFHLRKDAFAIGGVTWVLLVMMSVIVLLLGSQIPDTPTAVLMVVSNLTFLVMFGLILTWGRIADSELRFRENFLRLELQLSELAEHLAGEKDE